MVVYSVNSLSLKQQPKEEAIAFRLSSFRQADKCCRHLFNLFDSPFGLLQIRVVNSVPESSALKEKCLRSAMETTDLNDYTVIKEGEAEILMHNKNKVFLNKAQVSCPLPSSFFFLLLIGFNLLQRFFFFDDN